jgi:hypothetical protein
MSVSVTTRFWLNLPIEDRHVFYHLPMDDHHLGCIEKSLKKSCSGPLPNTSNRAFVLFCLAKFPLQRVLHRGAGMRKGPDIFLNIIWIQIIASGWQWICWHCGLQGKLWLRTSFEVFYSQLVVFVLYLSILRYLLF